MSRSKPQSSGSSSPIKFRFNFSGKSGNISYYDKETRENVELNELRFIVLDKRSSITGFSEADNNSIYSNMVHNLSTDDLVVKAGSRTIVSGLYADIKSKLSDVDGKFTTNVLCLVDMDGKWEMANIQFVKSGLAAWMSFEQGKMPDGTTAMEEKPDVNGSIITISKGEARKKGAVKYFIPAFDVEPLSKKLDALAMEQDIALQEYFSGAPSAKKEEEEEEEEEAAPAPKSKVKAPAAKAKGKAKPKPVEEEEEDEDDNLPF